MKRPSNMLNYPRRDLKLGIKSSLPNPRSAIGLLLLLWEISNKADKIEYAEEDNGVLKVKDSIIESIKACPECNNLELNQLRDKIESNNLFTSQIEALIVAFELIWCLGKFEFSDGRTVTAERTGGKRFSKIVLFTANMDIIDSAFSNNKSEFRKVLLKWIGFDVNVDTSTESNLVRILTILSENSVYKLKDGSDDIIFNNLSIYNELRSTTEIDIKGDEEAKGSLRILLSELKDNLNANLKYENDKVVSNSVNAEDLNKYAKRVNTLLLLSNDKEQGLEKTAEQHKINPDLSPFSHNRIIFGAPGTGKSYKFKEETKRIEEQEPIELDIEAQIKEEITSVARRYGKSNYLAAIGIKYSDVLKTKTMEQLKTEYNLNNAEELYNASRAKEIADELEINEEADDKEEQIKKLVDSARNNSNKTKTLIAIGYKFSDYLFEMSTTYLKEAYSLTSESEIAWMYRGAQAGQVETIKEKKDRIKYLERVTFHPNYSYSQFVGTYKPVKNEQEEITYEYIPGPFMRIYVNAVKELNRAKDKQEAPKNFLLLIEEINRANVAAVFGDMFQLLDRKNGKSEYPIAASEDQKKYLESCGIDDDEISIPSNMYIWATMNSADQGVFPMDAAFKRRWNFEYLPIDDLEIEAKLKEDVDRTFEDGIIYIGGLDDDLNNLLSYRVKGKKGEKGEGYYNWYLLRKAINETLKSKVEWINEDKLLGPWFIKSDDKDGKTISADTFCNKVLMYLYEDVVKIQPDVLFEKAENSNALFYSDIKSNWEQNGIEAFVENVEAEYDKLKNSVPHEKSSDTQQSADNETGAQPESNGESDDAENPTA